MRGSEYQMSLTEGNTFTVKANIRQNDGTFETKVIDPKYIKIQYSKDVSFDGDDWNGKESVKWTTNPEGARSSALLSMTRLVQPCLHTAKLPWSTTPKQIP